MKNLFIGFVCVGGVFILAADDAWAIEARILKPELAIDSGEGFKVAPRNTQVVPGDRVYATPEGLGQIIYDEDCVVEVKPDRVHVVRDRCPKGLVGWILPGLGIAGATAGIIALTSDDDDDKKTKPASP